VEPPVSPQRVLLAKRTTSLAMPRPNRVSERYTGRSRHSGGSHPWLASQLYLTIIQVMTRIIPLADAKARLSAVLDDVRDTHDRVLITRNGRPEAVIISVADLETIEETLDLLSTPGAIDEIRTAEAEIARGEAIGADELRRLMAERVRNERNAG
jgi:antitoxin YefM